MEVCGINAKSCTEYPSSIAALPMNGLRRKHDAMKTEAGIKRYLLLAAFLFHFSFICHHLQVVDAHIEFVANQQHQ